MIHVSEFWTSKYGQAALDGIQSRGSQYWANNIYRYYKQDTGKLGQACDITVEDGIVIIGMKPIYGIQRDGTIHEYGQDIMNGIRPGPGKYNPVRGVRIKTGYYPGVSVTKFWEPWLAEFEPAMLEIVREEVSSNLRDFITEQFKQGA